MKTSVRLVAIVALGLAGSAFADMGIATGSTSGSYYRLASEIQSTCKSKVGIKVVESAGSLSNIERIISDPQVQYGIVQLDALVYKKLQDDAVTKKIKMVFPFYKEEIHIVGRTGITNFSQLAGRKVAIGAQGSGNWVTSQIIASKTNIKWTPVEVAPNDGITQLANGSVDAVVVVGGKPYPALRDLGPFATGKIQLISLQHPTLDGFYSKAMIPEGIYPWQKTPVQTYAVQSILATYDYKSPVMQKDIGNMVSCTINNLNKLQATGHPKWREVDPSDLKKVNWPVHPAALRMLK